MVASAQETHEVADWGTPCGFDPPHSGSAEVAATLGTPRTTRFVFCLRFFWYESFILLLYRFDDHR